MTQSIAELKTKPIREQVYYLCGRLEGKLDVIECGIDLILDCPTSRFANAYMKELCEDFQRAGNIVCLYNQIRDANQNEEVFQSDGVESEIERRFNRNTIALGRLQSRFVTAKQIAKFYKSHSAE